MVARRGNTPAWCQDQKGESLHPLPHMQIRASKLEGIYGYKVSKPAPGGVFSPPRHTS